VRSVVLPDDAAEVTAWKRQRWPEDWLIGEAFDLLVESHDATPEEGYDFNVPAEIVQRALAEKWSPQKLASWWKETRMVGKASDPAHSYTLGGDMMPGGAPTADTIKQALAVLDRLPDDLSKGKGKILVPWARQSPSITPPDSAWEDATLKRVHIPKLIASTTHLDRDNLAWHIQNPGHSKDPIVMHPSVVKTGKGDRVIVEGHHRLAADWLLGVDVDLVWQVKQ
jgi:hypothetical protein